MRGTVLVVDDELRVRQSLERVLKENYEVRDAAGGTESLLLLKRERVDVVVLDYYLLDSDAAELIPKIRAVEQPPEIVVISGKAHTREAIECLKMGAFDFVIKPYVTEELLATIANAFHKRALERGRLELLTQTLDRYQIVGSSQLMQRVRREIALYADSAATVLITGPTGTGKELIAHQIHYLSPRSSGPLRIVNCAAVPKELADSELFGHVRGAFTGAIADKPGKVEIADGGSLFLDEIGEMPLELQAKLLRFLESRQFERIGENQMRSADVRIVAATHRNLMDEVAAGRFRQDLFYRLNVCVIRVPGLHEHPEDIPELVAHFSLRTAIRNNRVPKTFSRDAVEELMSRQWPGNVRELLNTVEQALIYFPQETISAFDLRSLSSVSSANSNHLENGTLAEILERTEQEIITRRIALFGGRIDKAAESLGIHRSSIHRKLKTRGEEGDENGG